MAPIKGDRVLSRVGSRASPWQEIGVGSTQNSYVDLEADSALGRVIS